MIQLKILTGKMAGTNWVARRLPVRIGRSAASHLRVEEDGVWDDHLEINVDPKEGFILDAHPNALCAINGQPVSRAVLRNGDLIEIGSQKIQFWLAESRQRGLKIREGLVWAIIAAISLAQAALIYWLIR